jgi:hypothetical protein
VLEHVRGGELEIRLDDALPGSYIDARRCRCQHGSPNLIPSRLDIATTATITKCRARCCRAACASCTRSSSKQNGAGTMWRTRTARRASSRRATQLRSRSGIFSSHVGNHTYSLNVSEEKVLLRGVAEERKRQQEQYRRQFPLYASHERVD